MLAPDQTTTMILTEHFGFPPILLVDDVINLVNEIMYKCTAALEKYLSSKKDTLPKNTKKDTKKSNDKEDQLDEIEVGTSKLETLMESSVDINFDLFELYTLRNVLNIPKELVEHGWIRLEHHQDMKVISGIARKNKEVQKAIIKAEKEIKMALWLRKKLVRGIKRARAFKKLLELYKSALSIVGNDVSPETLAALKELAPLNESLLFIKNESKELYRTVKELQRRFDKEFMGNETIRERDEYMEKKSREILKVWGKKGKDLGSSRRIRARFTKSSREVANLKQAVSNLSESLEIKESDELIE